MNSLSANPTKWSITLNQFVGNLPTNGLSVFHHFVVLVVKGLGRANMLEWIAGYEEDQQFYFFIRFSSPLNIKCESIK